MPPKTTAKKAATPRKRTSKSVPTSVKMYPQRWEFPIRILNENASGESLIYHDTTFVTDIERVDGISPYVEFTDSTIMVGNLTEIYVGGSVLVCIEPFSQMIQEYDQLKHNMFVNRSIIGGQK
jgi:hypothetical protein